MPSSDNSDVPDARMRRSARFAVCAGVLAIFIIGFHSSGDWARSLFQALTLMVIVLLGARVAFGKSIWKLLY